MDMKLHLCPYVKGVKDMYDNINSLQYKCLIQDAAEITPTF